MLQITGTRGRVVALPSDSLSFPKTSRPQSRDQGSARLQSAVYVQAQADRCSDADGTFLGHHPAVYGYRHSTVRCMVFTLIFVRQLSVSHVRELVVKNEFSTLLDFCMFEL